MVFCPESKDGIGNTEPARRRLNQANGQPAEVIAVQPTEQPVPATTESPAVPAPISPAPIVISLPLVELKEQHFTILYGDTGYSYESIIGPYPQGAKSVVIETRTFACSNQIQNFVALLRDSAES